MELLWDEEFAPREFKLDRMLAPPVAPEVADAIGLRYGTISLRAKSKFYADQVKVEIARLKMLTSQGCRRMNEMEQELKYIKGLEVARAKEASILKAVRDQQRQIRHEVCDRTEAMDEPVVVDDSDDGLISKWVVGNPEVVLPVEPADDKQPSSSRAAANQAGSTAIGPNNADGRGNAGGSNAVDFGAGNDVTGNAKVGCTAKLVSSRLSTATGTLAPTTPVVVCRHLAPVSSLVCGIKPTVLLSRAQPLSHASRAVSVSLSIRPFEDTQDISMYEGLLAAEDSDDD